MGTRLYPVTNDVCFIEKLAGVPAGTHERLKAFEAEKPAMGSADNEEWYDKLFADDDLHALHSFDLYGWGKLNGNVCDWLKAHGHDTVCGEVTDPDQAREILALQGVTAEGVTAIYWS